MNFEEIDSLLDQGMPDPGGSNSKPKTRTVDYAQLHKRMRREGDEGDGHAGEEEGEINDEVMENDNGLGSGDEVLDAVSGSGDSDSPDRDEVDGDIDSSSEDDEGGNESQEGGVTQGSMKRKRDTEDADEGDEGGEGEDEDQEEEVEGISEKEILVLDEKGKNPFEVGLPSGWIEVRHSSGMPVYLHRTTRVCSLTKPYFLGTGSARKHSIPLSAIPCLAYTKAIEREKSQPLPQIQDSQQPSGTCPMASNANQEGQGVSNEAGNPPQNEIPSARIETVQENNEAFSVQPLELREYCQKRFNFKLVKCKRFKTWNARRKHTKEQKRKRQRPSLPSDVKMIKFPVKTADNKYKEYILNPVGKTAVCILHEFVQHAMRKQPTYQYKELENAATPYLATVLINGLQYGSGFGSSKKQAKLEAAKEAVEVLMPDIKGQGVAGQKKLGEDNDLDVASFFSQVELNDSRIAKMCSSISEPSPYSLLMTCLQRNYGFIADRNIKFEMISAGNQTNKFRMTAGEWSAEVQALNKRDGKQLASQALLIKIHPEIKNFSSFLQLYGNRSIKSVKEKKQEEQSITNLQSKASPNTPNYAILNKLKDEMLKLKDKLEKRDSSTDGSSSTSERRRLSVYP